MRLRLSQQAMQALLIYSERVAYSPHSLSVKRKEYGFSDLAEEKGVYCGWDNVRIALWWDAVHALRRHCSAASYG